MNTNTTIVTPIVHLNGTGRQSLTDQRLAMYNSLTEALETLREMAPNGRDYYVASNGPERMDAAIQQHHRRQQVLCDLKDEIETELEMLEEVPHL